MSVQTEPQEATAPKAGGRLPLAVYLLAFSLFAMGSAEFLLAGVLPDIADDLDISLSSAGALISAFAIGVVIGGPPLAVLTLRWPRRTTLVTSQAVFAAGVAVGLLTDDFTVLLVTRFLIGLAYAGFWAVAAVTAISSSPPTAPHGPPAWWSAASASPWSPVVRPVPSSATSPAGRAGSGRWSSSPCSARSPRSSPYR